MGSEQSRSLSEAVASVADGANMTFGGFAAYFTPLAFVREMIRQGKRRIEMTSVAECWVADYLAGAGVLKRARFSNFMFEGLGRCQNFARGVERGEIEVEDYSHFAITSRLVAAGSRPPVHADQVHGGDRSDGHVAALRPKRLGLWRVRSPASPCCWSRRCGPMWPSSTLARSDRDGNSQLFGYTAVVEEQARAAQRVIVTTEEVVEDTVIRAQPELTVLPGFLVDAVVEVPFGAHPTGMYRYYDPDFEFMRDYYAASRDPAAFRAHLEEWVLGPGDHWAYLRKVGLRRLLALRSDPGLGIARMHARTVT